MNKIPEATEYPPIRYSITNAAIDQLREKHAVVHDAWTEDGYKKVSEAIKELTKLRNDIERTRKAIKKPALEYGRKIDTEAKRITARLVEIEKPHREAKEHKDAELRAREEARRDAINKRIAHMTKLCTHSVGQPSDKIESIIEELCGIDVSDEALFGEYTNEAGQTQQEALDKLQELLQAAEDRERINDQLEIERAEIEIQRKANEAKEAELAGMQAEIEKFKTAENERKEQQAREERRKREEAKAKKEALLLYKKRAESMAVLKEIVGEQAEALLRAICDEQVPHIRFDEGSKP